MPQSCPARLYGSFRAGAVSVLFANSSDGETVQTVAPTEVSLMAEDAFIDCMRGLFSQGNDFNGRRGIR